MLCAVISFLFLQFLTGNNNLRGLHLVVGSPETAPHIFVVEHLHLKAEVLLHVLDDHDQEGQLDSQSFVWVSRAADVGGGDVCAGNLEDSGLYVRVCDSLDVTIVNCKQKTV